MSKLVLFVNSDSYYVSGGRLAFYYLAEAYYRVYKNALLITHNGEALRLIRNKLTIPIQIIDTKMRKMTLRQFEYIYRLLRLEIQKPLIVISNQRVIAGFFYSKKYNLKHLYVMHGVFKVKSGKQIVDRLFRMVFHYTLKRTNFVSVSSSFWKDYPNHIGTIYNGAEF
ncbi:MAG: hypothetical protein ACFFAO_14715 [Candidatus Hermodarchaeota archaeon]